MSDKITDFELYKIALETRNFEISLFWQRSNYFLALNTAIAIGFFSKSETDYRLLLCIFGIAVSTLWLFINFGSKYWQSRWETRLKKAEDNINNDINYFSADWNTINDDACESLNFSNHSFFRKLIDKIILTKPSVSFMMILLSFFFIIFWISITCTEVYQLIQTKRAPYTSWCGFKAQRDKLPTESECVCKNVLLNYRIKKRLKPALETINNL